MVYYIALLIVALPQQYQYPMNDLHIAPVSSLSFL